MSPNPRGSGGAPTSRVVLRYAAFQLPGQAVMVLAASAAHEWLGLDTRVAVGAVLLWIVKDIVMFPWVRKAYEPGDGRHSREVRGTVATTCEELDPTGYVRVGSELWRAECTLADAPIAAGQRVRVLDARGLTLRVAPLPEEEKARGAEHLRP